MSIAAERVADFFDLRGGQRPAAIERTCDVVVTAGAGCGKTRTLVARYVSLLAEGKTPREVAAVTFTRKAAREMRSRVRQAVQDLLNHSETAAEAQHWADVSTAMDSARIGTIHSLCQEILRAHPAEALIDPRSELLDEGMAAVLQKEIITAQLALMAEMEDFIPLFRNMKISDLEGLFSFLLSRRLEVEELMTNSPDPRQWMCEKLSRLMDLNSVAACIRDLQALSNNDIEKIDNLKQAEQVSSLLEKWREAKEALQRGDASTSACSLYHARRDFMKLNIGKQSGQVKNIIRELQSAYDQLLQPVVGGKNSTDPEPDPQQDAIFRALLPLVQKGFTMITGAYQQARAQRRALDFDDLEAGALALLADETIRRHWQSEISSLLVDEFQDTNARQRKIVEAIAGSAGHLFVVGDARQSIYRFRRADVTVFRSLERAVSQVGGLVVDLDETFRTHQELLNASGELLAVVMGTEEDPQRPFHVPFTSLRAIRQEPPQHIPPPFVEMILGVGNKAAEGRPAAARGLAARLLELKADQQLTRWDDVVLLFRASSGFSDYENALEEAEIPFVTVAGRGFYDRPEIRDVLNILRALADPADDLAMAGLLRSPAFGLSDAALYQLRWQGDQPTPYRAALRSAMGSLAAPDLQRAERASTIVDELAPLVNRIPVAELLKRLIDACDYRAILAVDGNRAASSRLWRNLDKLLTDAYASQQVSVDDFLEYLRATRDAGARTGEASADAEQAVQLMTIHKAKGLEFPFVVLADAAYDSNGDPQQFILSPQAGLSFKLDPAPLIYKLAKNQEADQENSEEARLLYVALTRAKEKILISGHINQNKDEYKTRGWLQELITASGLDVDALAVQEGRSVDLCTAGNHMLRACLVSPDMPIGRAAYEKPSKEPAAMELTPLFSALPAPSPVRAEEDQPAKLHSWRASGLAANLPRVVGGLVHKALEVWLFPESAALRPLLEAAALNAGLADPAQREGALRLAIEYLRRLQDHPLRHEIETASAVYHELPYIRGSQGPAEVGYLDLLYQTPAGWEIIDFKTDRIRSVSEREFFKQKYTPQLRRYRSAVKDMLGQTARSRLCFLDDQGSLTLITIEG